MMGVAAAIPPGFPQRRLARVHRRYIISTTMESLDPAVKWRDLLERYRQMSDNEILELARQNSELTDAAQQALAYEIAQRRLKLPVEEAPAPPNPETPADSSYDEDRKLVEIRTVWSRSDAVQLQTLLDRAGVPFFMGPEKATGVDAVSSNFDNGVSVQIMNIGLPWARQALMNYTPTDEPGPKPEEELGEAPVRCPRCHSTEVIFERLLSEPNRFPQEFEWTCDSCGQQWEDDGIAKEE
jgi:DNA-directed RNA polymerase subunit M/transcription elongation factor TFIIS